MSHEMTEQFDRLKAALADRYAIERPIGAGGMATVYLARDPKHGRNVAVKVLRPELAATIGAERFLREIEIAAKLTHPHILPLYDSGEAEGFLYYVMPYVEGESLRDRLNREPQLSLVDALGVAREVADALSYAHAQDVVHRDIKPENILTHAGHVLVADFGIARAIGVSGVQKLTVTGTSIGTPAYMSPEQVGGEPQLDSRSDIYSLGCVLYEMLAGQPPFIGPTPESVCRQHVSAEVPVITAIRPLVPRGVVEILDDALAKRPVDRYQTAKELAEDLGRQASLATDPKRAASRRTRAARRRWSIVGTLAVVGALALLAGALGVLQRGPAPTARAVATQRQVTFVGNVAEASISPQGNFLVYTTRGPDGAALMVQDLESGSTIEIVSSLHRIVLPNWSPDGREILVGGGAPGEYTLLVYPRLGGDPYSRPTGEFAQWSVDGRQEYSWYEDGLWFSFYTIASDSHRRIRTADTTAWLQDIAQHPGGDVLALLHVARDGSVNSIWRVSVDSVQRFEVLPRDSAGRVSAGRYELLLEEDARLLSLEWSPGGDALYYLREDQSSYQLWKLRTPQGRATQNPPELLLSGLELAGGGVTFGPWSSLLSLTEDGSRLFYVKGRTFANLWSLRPRGDAWNVEQLTTGTATNLRPSLSPDGEWVAYNSRVAGRTNVFIVPSEGGSSRQLTHVDSVSGYPVWSSDGESLAFGLRRGGGNHVAIVNVTGSPSMKVFESTALSGNGTITWAPGAEILYQRPDIRNFHFLNPETEVERPLLSADSAAVGYALQVRYSPDRTQLAMYWNRFPRNEAGLYVIPLAEGVHRRLATQPDVLLVGWSEDGRTVYALSEDRRAVLAVPADGGTPTVLATLPFEAHWVGTTYYGRWFVFASSDATGDVWKIENFDPER